MTDQATSVLRVFRGDREQGGLVDYEVPMQEGMVVLDALHWIQAHREGSLAVRWNCKAAKCGSCSVEINGMPALACKTRMDRFIGQTVQVRPMKAFPIIKDLVSDVSWNYKKAKSVPPFTPSPEDHDSPETWTIQQEDVDRVYEFRKCIECFLCMDVCHVVRDHKRADFVGPAMIVKAAAFDMHPKDTVNRAQFLKDEAKIGYCNITKCCTEVCPEHIKITDNAIIPLKERVVGEYYDPVKWLWRKITGSRRQAAAESAGLVDQGAPNDAGADESMAPTGDEDSGGAGADGSAAPAGNEVPGDVLFDGDARSKHAGDPEEPESSNP